MECTQPQIHTGFHRFTGIGKIFHNKYIFIKKASKLKSRDENKLKSQEHEPLMSGLMPIFLF